MMLIGSAVSSVSNIAAHFAVEGGPTGPFQTTQTKSEEKATYPPRRNKTEESANRLAVTIT